MAGNAVQGEYLNLSQQENLLILAVWNDKALPLIRNSLEARLFGNWVYRDIVTRAYEFYDQFKRPPKEHIADLLEDRLSGNKDQKNALLYAELLDSLRDHKDSVHVDYVMGQLEAFIGQQSLKESIITASEALQAGNLEEAQEVLQKGAKRQLTAFQPGTGLQEGLAKAFAGDTRKNVLSLGIIELDRWRLGAGAGEYHLYIAGPKAGKSWWLVHVAKRGLLQQQRVLYVSLELSEAEIEMRVLQSLFAVTKTTQAVQVTRLKLDSLGRLLHFEPDSINPKASFDDLSSKPLLERKLGLLHPRRNLIVKQFPAGSLTVRGLASYLEMLEQGYNFVPDMLIIDYPKYMKIKADNYRIESGILHNELRGLAVERGMAVYAAKESNREGVGSKLMTGQHSGEDYSAVYTADTVFTYSRTEQERKLGLARLFVDSSRVAERDKFVVLLTQAYPIGQYCLGSAAMADNYLGLLEQSGDLYTEGDEA